MNRVVTATATVALLAALCGCAAKPPDPAPAAEADVVLISIDTLRADHLPAYGATAIETPAIDAFGAESILFENAWSPYPLTLPAHVSVMTGLSPPAHGVRDNNGFALPEGPVTLAERLAAAGARTAGFVSSVVLRRSTGIARGFEVWDADFEKAAARPGARFAQRAGEETVRRALSWLNGRPPGERVFLFVHLYEPHTPWEAPEPWRSRYADPYDAEVAWADAVVGKLLEGLRASGRYDGALIVLLSDHGEGLGDHGEREHGLLLYREALHVPLFVRLPGAARAGERVAGNVGLVDVAPTILAAIGAPPLEPADGAPLVAGGAPPAPRPLYAETYFPRSQYGWSELRSVVRERLHYIAGPDPELYDLEADPAERTNLADPKRVVPHAEALWAVAEGRADARSLGEERLLEHARAVGPANTYLHVRVVRALLAAGRVESAARLLEELGAEDRPELLVSRGEVELARGRPDAALADFDRALEGEPALARAWLGRAIVALGRDTPRAALEPLERAVALDPTLGEAWNALGVARMRTGDLAGAAREWAIAVERDPSLGDAWFNLALARRGTGDVRGASAALERYASLAEGTERERALRLLGELERTR